MLKYLLCFAVLLGSLQTSSGGPIRDARPRVDKIVEAVTPEVYEVTVTLSTGEVIKTDKVALSAWSFNKRFTLNSADKVVRVLPKGEKKMRVIPVDLIDKVEVVKVKDEPTPAPTPEPVPATPDK